MRIFTTVLSFLLISLCSSVQAVEPVSDHQVMLYYYIPIGADNNNDRQHKFGLRFDRTMHDPRQVSDFSSVVNRPAMLDLQFQQKNNALAFRVNGVDYSERLKVQHANAAENENTGVKPSAEGAVGEEGEVATEGEAASENGTSESEQPEDKKAEKTIVQKTLDELPFGVIMGVAIGAVIFSGAGG